MDAPTGHDPGHPLEGQARAWTWADVVDALVAERGSLAELARHLIDVAPASARLSQDPGTVERGLRRLRARGSREGNTYGRLVLRCLGTPGAMTRQLRALGQYHSRACDMSVGARHAQLTRWDRPPVTESRDAIWVHLAMATVAHQRGERDVLEQRVALTRALWRHAEPMARVEASLFFARLALDAGDQDAARGHLDDADAVLAEADLTADARACYLARALDQRAYFTNRAWRDDPGALERALELYARIPQGPGVHPFAAFRRAHGRAWCLWRLGRRDDALACARRAARHAGDGGYVRFRVMALMLEAHIVGEGGARDALARRAVAMAARLGDAALEEKARRLM